MALLACYAGLFAWSFLAATALPPSSEAPLATLVGVGGRLVAPVLVATAGNVLGYCTTYRLGRRARSLVRGRSSALVKPRKKGAGGASAPELRRAGVTALFLAGDRRGAGRAGRGDEAALAHLFVLGNARQRPALRGGGLSRFGFKVTLRFSGQR